MVKLNPRVLFLKVGHYRFIGTKDPDNGRKTHGDIWYQYFISGVLIAGGFDNPSFLSSAEVYNSYTGTTCSVGDLPSARGYSSLCHGMVCGGNPGSK